MAGARSQPHERSCEAGWTDSAVERLDSIVGVEWKDLSVVERAEVLYCIGVPVVSEAYSRDGGSVEGEVAIVVRHPAAGSMFEGAEDGI